MHHLTSLRFNKTQSFKDKVTYPGFKKIRKYLRITIDQIRLLRTTNIYHMQAGLAHGKTLILVLLKSLKWGIEWKINLIFRWTLIMMRLIKREISNALLYPHTKKLRVIKAENKGQYHRGLLLICPHFKSLPVNLLMERWEIISSVHKSKSSSINNSLTWRVLTQHLITYLI